jgi:hypothetical protein
MIDETKSISQEKKENFNFENPQNFIQNKIPLRCKINTTLFGKNVTEHELSRVCYLNPIFMLKNSTHN